MNTEDPDPRLYHRFNDSFTKGMILEKGAPFVEHCIDHDIKLREWDDTEVVQLFRTWPELATSHTQLNIPRGQVERTLNRIKMARPEINDYWLLMI